MEKKIFSLSEVSKSIKKTISERYKSEYWIQAELNKLNFYKQSGHCFPELVEKDGSRVIAQMRSVVWNDDFTRINQKFIEVLKEPLKDGIKILFLAGITFDPVYGLSLRIIEIDPAYTLGDIEKEKQETIQRLKDLGIYDQNKLRSLALLPQRIAIISDETSKGYADFINVLRDNSRGYHFFQMLFPSLLQGERAIGTIIQQLNRIRSVKEHFDLVVIVRGGGDDIGLSCFNHFKLAREIALFPLPVLTGIGHSTNETVSELVAFSNAITPTKLAEYLIQIFNEFADPLQRAEQRITEQSVRILKDEKLKIRSLTKLFHSVTDHLLTQNKSEMKIAALSLNRQVDFRFRNELSGINRLQQTIAASVIHLINKNHSDLMAIERNVYNMSPENVLKRGYSITLLNGKAIKNPESLKKGDEIESVVAEGSIISTVKSSGKN